MSGDGSRHPERIPSFLAHMLLAIDRISSYLENLSREDFISDTLVQDAVIRNLEIVGEASRNILRADAEFPARHPELPLLSAYEMRNALAHGYFEVDMTIVWDTTQRDLPRLRRQVSALLDRMRSGNHG